MLNTCQVTFRLDCITLQPGSWYKQKTSTSRAKDSIIKSTKCRIKVSTIFQCKMNLDQKSLLDLGPQSPKLRLGSLDKLENEKSSMGHYDPYLSNWKIRCFTWFPLYETEFPCSRWKLTIVLTGPYKMQVGVEGCAYTLVSEKHFLLWTIGWVGSYHRDTRYHESADSRGMACHEWNWSDGCCFPYFLQWKNPWVLRIGCFRRSLFLNLITYHHHVS